MSVLDDKLQEFGVESVQISLSGGPSGSIEFNGSSFRNWYDRLDPESRHIFHFHAKITGTDEMGDDIVDIGKFYGDYFNLEEIALDDDLMSFQELCDIESQELLDFASAITDSDGDILESVADFDDRIIYFDRLYIEPQFRGLGIGSFIIENLREMFFYTFNFGFNKMILKPVPQGKDEKGMLGELQSDTLQQDKKRLVALYEGLGCKWIEGTEYMVKDMLEREN